MNGTPWSGSGFQIGDLNLDSREPDTGVRWGVETFDGWGATKGTLSPVQKPRGSGGWAGDAFDLVRSMSISGWMAAPDAITASMALDRLNDAVSLYPTLMVVTEAGRARWLMVRRSDEVLTVWKSDRAFTWSIQIVALDPRKFGDKLTASTGLPSSSGGLLLPATVPFSIDAVSNSGQVSLENVGNEAGPVLQRIDGPVHGPVITHVSSGLSLVFASSLVLGVGEWLDIDMEARSVMANGQASRSGYVISRGWSNFTPGQNTWAFTAASYDAGARFTVSATPAWK